MNLKAIIISCSIFKAELDYLKNKGKINVPIVYLDSMLHMNPKKLQEILDKVIKEYPDYKIILAFGDCHARMIDYEKNPTIIRTPGINCAEIFMGTDNYKKARKEGAFILLPEWADRWKEAFVERLGFKTSKQLQPFMNDMHKKLLYVDTGYQDINYKLLNEISEYMGLPLEIYTGSIDELEATMNELIHQDL